MAENFHFLSRTCLEWTTDKPFRDSPRRSPGFKLLGCDWYFLFKLVVDTYSSGNVNVYILSIHNKEKKSLHEGCVITALLTQSTDEKYLTSASSVLKAAVSEIFRYSYGCSVQDSGNGLWTVHCIFSTDVRSELLINGSETVHLSQLPDSDSQNSSTRSSVIMKAKLAAIAPDDSLSDMEFLFSDFSKLLQQKSFSDVTLRCGDCTFYAHRNILAARSEVFAAMFKIRMVEKETGSIDITDIDGKVLELLLKYVYTGKISNVSADIASRLYMAADKYCIQSLKSKCSNWMLGSLTEENCLNFLLLADACSDEKFKDRLIIFIGKILGLLEEETWLKFSDQHPKLAISVYRRELINKEVKCC